MKLNKNTLLLAALFVFLFSCKKNDHNNQTRLTRFDYNNNLTSWSNVLNYNSENKIISIDYRQSSGITSPLFQVSYSGNQLIISRNSNSADLIENTTITYTLDADGKPLKRIQNYYVELKIDPQKDYKKDTITYEYDAAGLLLKETKSGYDSTWAANSSISVTASVIKGVTNYTNTNGNLISSSEVTTNTGYNIQGNQVVNWKMTDENNFSYEYTKNYPNKTDFSNATVLNHYGAFGHPLNKNYKNMPDKVKYSYVKKDANGNVMTSITGESGQTLEYNNKGLLSSVVNSSQLDPKKTLIYGK